MATANLEELGEMHRSASASERASKKGNMPLGVIPKVAEPTSLLFHLRMLGEYMAWRV